MRIQHNISALNSYRQLATNNTTVSKNLEKLSSGFRINRAGDDAAGLAISEKMRGQIRGLEMGQKNAQDGISLVQTAEGALQETHSILQRMRELSVQSSNGTYDNASDRAALQAETDRLVQEIDRIGNSTSFNGIKLLNGSAGGYAGTATTNTSGITGISVSGGKLTASDDITFTTTAGGAIAVDEVGGAALPTGVTFTSASVDPHGSGSVILKAVVGDTATVADQKKYAGVEIAVSYNGTSSPMDATGASFNITGASSALTLQIGANGNANEQVSLTIGDMRASSLGVSSISISDQTSAQGAIATIETAIGTVSTQRGNLGALQNRLEHTINNLGTSSENLTAAESRIRDVDMAKEMMEMTKNNILTQAAQAMLAQANTQPQGVLQLLR